LYCELEKYAEAVPELETAVAMKPNNALGQEDLGGAYLALGEIDKGLAMLNKLAQDQPTATTLNSVAYRLASHRVRLDLAQRYAATALTSTETALAAGAEAPPTLGALRQVSMLSHCWDTLGWVHFQQGNLDEAERFIAAAWSANPDGPIGDHLGRIYERRGQKHEALRAYARALAGPGALPQTRRRLEALVGAGEAAPEVDRLVAAVPAGKLLAETASADFYLVQARKPAVAEAQFIRGDDRLRPFFKVVQEVTPAAILPGATPTRLVRRVTLTCPGEGRDSSIELLPASAAVLAELNAIPPDTHLASEQTPGAPAVYHIGGDGVTNPVAIYMPEPQYSKEALKKRIQGTVTLHIVVDRAGNPRNFKVIQGLGYGLDEKAIEAVSQWKFRPGMKDGQTVNVAATINVSFRLQNDH
jgi:TonB family protein